MLSGVSVARLTKVKPPALMTCAIRASRACALKGREGIRLRVGDRRVIMDDQGNVLAVLDIGPRGLRAAAEDLADLQSYDRARASLAGGEDELIPSDYANRLLDGEDPLRVYRNLRGLTQATLAERAGVNRVTVAEIETGRK